MQVCVGGGGGSKTVNCDNSTQKLSESIITTKLGNINGVLQLIRFSPETKQSNSKSHTDLHSRYFPYPFT